VTTHLSTTPHGWFLHRCLGIVELILVCQDWGGPIGVRPWWTGRTPQGLVVMSTALRPPTRDPVRPVPPVQQSSRGERFASGPSDFPRRAAQDAGRPVVDTGRRGPGLRYPLRRISTGSHPGPGPHGASSRTHIERDGTHVM
jgi:hypothetical protein